MKMLLYKQLRLVCQPMTLVFCLFGVMLLIWPTLIPSCGSM